MNYQETLDYIYSFVDYSLVRNLRYAPEKFNLDRMRNFVKELGDPQDRIKCIHVAGTKGKGSVCAMLANILYKQGYTVGLYTSPHLYEFTERIQVNGKQISKHDFVKSIESMIPAIEKINNIGTFEITTAVAFQYFAQRHVDIAIIEVGLGGRLDATNIITPELCVITSISHDHMAILGKTLEKIAREKGGIIKNGTPVISSSKRKSVENVLKKIAVEKGAKYYQVADYITQQIKHTSIAEQVLEIKTSSGNKMNIFSDIDKLPEIPMPLIGPHQAVNASTAILAIMVLRSLGWIVSEQAIFEGLRTVKWPGRFELISNDPNIVIDCAHNVDSIQKLIATTKTIMNLEKTIWLFGASEDKNIDGMFKYLSSHTKTIYLTKSMHPRAASLDVLKNYAEKYFQKIFLYESSEEAIVSITSNMASDQYLICTGSIFIAAAVRSILLRG